MLQSKPIRGPTEETVLKEFSNRRKFLQGQTDNGRSRLCPLRGLHDQGVPGNNIVMVVEGPP